MQHDSNDIYSRAQSYLLIQIHVIINKRRPCSGKKIMRVIFVAKRYTCDVNYYIAKKILTDKCVEIIFLGNVNLLSHLLLWTWRCIWTRRTPATGSRFFFPYSSYRFRTGQAYIFNFIYISN